MKIRYCVAGALAAVWTLGAAWAADLQRPIYTKAPPAPPPMYNWTGFYIGANVGGSWGSQDVTLEAPTAVITNSNHLDGVIGGGQIGYNWQGIGSPWVFGLEADFQGSGQKGDGSFAIAAIPGVGAPGVVAPAGTPATGIAYEDKLEWFGTVRGRIGYAMGDMGTWMPYITGGLAYGQGNINGSGSTGSTGGVTTAVAFDSTNTYVGWTAGAGLEWAFAPRWSAKIEYLYMDLGNGPTIALSPGFALTTGRLTDNIARVGVNYHF